MIDLTTLEKYREHEKERRIYGCNGDSGNGIFRIFVGGKAFYCLVSNGGGWEHVSVSMKSQKRCPTWEEMCRIKEIFFAPEECVVEYHPAKNDYVNRHEYCLHLWRPVGGGFPRPPKLFV